MGTDSERASLLKVVMRIVDVERHIVCPPLKEWNSDALTHHQGPDFRYRTVYVLHTDNGLEGLGEHRGKSWPGVEEWLSQLVGTNPCDWLAHPTLPVGLAAAVYDLIGKYNRVPVYKLFGPKLRNRVPLAAWTVSQTPSKMAAEAQHAVEAGFTWLKYHTSHFHNVIAQTEAIQAVAPQGFKIHYDLNFDSSVEHMLHLANELKKFPVAGALEDPLRTHDYEGYRLLRQKCQLPIYFHHLPLGGREVMLGCADGIILGHTPVGDIIRRAGLFEAANIPFRIQNTGGSITRAFISHMAAAMPAATLHHSGIGYLWAEDVAGPDLPVEGGMVSVPEEPGLGKTLDRKALQRWSAASPEPLRRALIRIQYRGRPTIYARLPVRSLSDHRGKGPSFVDGFGSGYSQPVDQDYLDDDGSREFADLWERTASHPPS